MKPDQREVVNVEQSQGWFGRYPRFTVEETGDSGQTFQRGRQAGAERQSCCSLAANWFDSTGSQDGLQDVP